MRNLDILPHDLSIPMDDGLTNHLPGINIPDLKLKSTSGRDINIHSQFQKPTVSFVYPVFPPDQNAFTVLNWLKEQKLKL
jgi:hypothetical protein